MKRILAVDDSRTLREMLFDCLTGAGHEVFTACDGAEALDALRQHRPDIVITDLNMPVMDGEQFARELRKRPDLNDVAVVVVSTETNEERLERMRQLGPVNALHKPFEPEELRDLIASVLGVKL